MAELGTEAQVHLASRAQILNHCAVLLLMTRVQLKNPIRSSAAELPATLLFWKPDVICPCPIVRASQGNY